MGKLVPFILQTKGSGSGIPQVPSARGRGESEGLGEGRPVPAGGFMVVGCARGGDGPPLVLTPVRSGSPRSSPHLSQFLRCRSQTEAPAARELRAR